MNRARMEVERSAGPDHLHPQHRVPGRAELELGAARLDEPRLVLHAMELQAEGLAGLHNKHLADVMLGLRPDELVAPGLLHLARLEGPRVEPPDVRRVHAHRATLCRPDLSGAWH